MGMTQTQQAMLSTIGLGEYASDLLIFSDDTASFIYRNTNETYEVTAKAVQRRVLVTEHRWEFSPLSECYEHEKTEIGALTIDQFFDYITKRRAFS